MVRVRPMGTPRPLSYARQRCVAPVSPHRAPQPPTSRPIGVLAATAALSMSPVARWQRQCSCLIRGLWVPLPQPGGPASAQQHRHRAGASVRGAKSQGHDGNLEPYTKRPFCWICAPDAVTHSGACSQHQRQWAGGAAHTGRRDRRLPALRAKACRCCCFGASPTRMILCSGFLRQLSRCCSSCMSASVDTSLRSSPPIFGSVRVQVADQVCRLSVLTGVLVLGAGVQCDARVSHWRGLNPWSLPSPPSSSWEACSWRPPS